jgi:hypothetical protein
MFEQLRECRGTGSFLFHLLIATIGTVLLSGFVAFLLEHFLNRDVVSLIALGPFFLLPIISGLVLGYFLAPVFPSRGIRWIWAVPAFFLILNIMRSFSNSYERKNVWVNEFGPQSRCTACLDETFLTAPLIGCIGYAAGARIRNRRSQVTLDIKE